MRAARSLRETDLSAQRAFSASMSLGTTLWTSPTMPRSANAEDRRLRVLVDGDDVVRALHARPCAASRRRCRRRCRPSASRSCRSGRPGIEYGTQPASTIARDAPGAPLSSLASSSTMARSFGLAEPAAAGDDDRRLLELRPGRAPRRARPRPSRAPGAPSVGDRRLDDLGRAAAAGSAANDFGRNAARYGPSPLNVGRRRACCRRRSAVLTVDRVAVDLDVDAVGEHRAGRASPTAGPSRRDPS